MLIDKPMLEPNQRRARVGMLRSNERINGLDGRIQLASRAIHGTQSSRRSLLDLLLESIARAGLDRWLTDKHKRRRRHRLSP
ncbi:hypothetical protein ARMGADRAFT_1013595 [Armillaria gallica]|uniref:Uncharacterized protein n=1 Tax=Armillaria gallica TaxID=47427 RepID=A0A2H3DRR3_ARMGA|nr:hypothetical protein ARMGADRAFT_1013595 [Armillaria gallica]